MTEAQGSLQLESDPSASSDVVHRAPGPAARPRLAGLGRLPGPRALLVVLGLGLLVRAVLMYMWFPSAEQWIDGPRFMRIGMGTFEDYWMPAGYPGFLAAIRLFSDELGVTIALQHLVGLGASAALFFAVRRSGGPVWIAVIPTAFAALSGDTLYLEHIVMSDFLLFAFACVGLAAGLRGLVPRIDLRWLAAGAVLLACAGLARTPGVVLPACLAVAAFVAGDGLRERLRAAAVVAGAAAVLLLGYAGIANVGGSYDGLTEMSGWNLYSRVAPFADCGEFDAPAETRFLCEKRPPEQRPGPFGYVWDPNALARQRFELGPESAQKLGKFARKAILAQPGDYASAVGSDLLRYLDAGAVKPNPIGWSGQGRDLIWFGYRDEATENGLEVEYAKRYDGTVVHLRGQRVLSTYHNLTRPGGLLLLAALVLGVLGAFRSPTPGLRLGALLFTLSALALFVLPTLTLSWDYRYGIPPTMLAITGGAIGAAGLLARRRLLAR